MKKILSFLFIVTAIISLANAASPTKKPSLTDKAASLQTQILYNNLFALQGKQFLFGHQDTTAYGFLWHDEPTRSDVKDVTGAFPALYGWDVSQIENNHSHNVDGVSFDIVKREIINAYKRGGVNTISWHMKNPVTGGGHSDTSVAAIHDIIPSGRLHERYKQSLDAFVAFNEQLVVTLPDGKKQQIPLIFRPFHEHNGDWFWWGKGHTSEADFITLWRFTIDYLREQKQQHNLIIAFSPDRSRIDLEHIERDYLYGYPGDEYVDIIGLDDYFDVGRDINPATPEEQHKAFVESLTFIAQLARQKNKIPALTETGLESISNSQFWTDVLLKGLLANKDTQQMAYAMVWRNATDGGFNKKHFYAPYKGQASANNFLLFKKNRHLIFGDNLPHLYEK